MQYLLDELYLKAIRGTEADGRIPPLELARRLAKAGIADLVWVPETVHASIKRRRAIRVREPYQFDAAIRTIRLTGRF